MNVSGEVFEWRVSDHFCPNEEDSGSIVLWIFSDGAKIINIGAIHLEIWSVPVGLSLSRNPRM